MFKYIISGILILFFFCSFGQGTDYKPKKLYKEIKKVWRIENPVVTPVELPDSLVKSNHINGKFFSISDNNNVSQIRYLYVGRVNSCRSGGCSITLKTVEDFETEYFDYFILFDSAATVQQLCVYNYMATHGHEISAKGWLRQFTGYNGTNTLEVGKNVDAISGATISVYGITSDVQINTQILSVILGLEPELTTQSSP